MGTAGALLACICQSISWWEPASALWSADCRGNLYTMNIGFNANCVGFITVVNLDIPFHAFMPLCWSLHLP